MMRSTHSTLGPPPEAPAALLEERRERLLGLIGEGIALIPAARELYLSRDTEVPYRQSSDLHYLTGFPEPESLAVLTPHDPEHRFTLFVRPRDPARELWSGARYGPEGAAERFGADAVYPIAELEHRLSDLLRPADRIHYPFGVDDLLDARVAEAVVAGRRSRQRTGTGPAGIVDLEVSTGEMRLLKDDFEVDRIRAAARIAVEGHLAATRRIVPGAGEWEVQASLEGTFRSMGGAAPAFLSIVGSGENATTLHYVANRDRLHDGDLVLIDAGADWGMYCSDITRTYPVSGRFEPHQRDVYEIVLAAEEAGIAAARPGAPVTAIHEAVVQVLVRGLLDLRILTADSPEEAIESGEYRRFYPHQSSHWLGVDVHDAGPYARGGEPVELAAGMVLTVEPGIYIRRDAEDVPERFRGIGIRIEDDIVVGTSGNEILTRGVPVEPERIEALLGGSGLST